MRRTPDEERLEKIGKLLGLAIATMSAAELWRVIRIVPGGYAFLAVLLGLVYWYAATIVLIILLVPVFSSQRESLQRFRASVASVDPRITLTVVSAYFIVVTPGTWAAFQYYASHHETDFHKVLLLAIAGGFSAILGYLVLSLLKLLLRL